MLGVRYILEQCHKEGVEYFFGMQGGQIAPVFNELLDFTEIKAILVRHEQAASLSATGYAWITGIAQLCGGTVGPGGVNLVSGMHVAYQNSKPLLAITANNASTSFGKMDTQDASGWGPRTISHVEMAKPVTKWTQIVFCSELLPEAVRRAFRIMYSGRPGPVLLDIPFDVLSKDVEAEVIPPGKYRPTCRIRGDPDKIREAAELLVNAQSPSILSGGGVLGSEASPELLELADLLKIPVATTFMGKSSFPEDHPLALGVAGLGGHELPRKILRKDQTDVLLAIASIFHGKTTEKWSKDFGGERIIQVDIDPTEIGKNYPVDVGIVGDAKLVLRDIIDYIKKLLRKMNPEKRKRLMDHEDQRIKAILSLKGEVKYYAEPQMFSDATPIKPQRALKELRQFLRKDAILLTDAGNNLMWSERYLQTYFPRTFIADGGHTSMGASIPLSIGVKLGAPEKQVVAVLGNGGFHMLCHEVVTAAAHTIPVIWFILNDRALGAIAHFVGKFGYGTWEPERYAVGAAPGIYDMDFVKFADACGVYGERVEKPGDINEALKRAFDSGKPAIIDVLIDPEEVHPGTIYSYRKVIQKYPDLVKRRMKTTQYPIKVIPEK